MWYVSIDAFMRRNRHVMQLHMHMDFVGISRFLLVMLNMLHFSAMSQRHDEEVRRSGGEDLLEDREEVWLRNGCIT